MRTAAADSVYHFDGFVLDLISGMLITASGVSIHLRHKSFCLLHLLVQNAGRLVDRDTINRAIWPDVTVSDDSITQCVGDIRRALRDEAHAIVKTVPHRGYIFAAKVNVRRDQLVQRPFGNPVHLPDRPSIAVLPFVNLSADPEQEYLSNGIAGDIVTELAQSRALFVVGRHSSFAYKSNTKAVRHVAHALGVRYVLEGSVQLSGDRIRVVARLVDGGTGEHIWADRFSRHVEDIFLVQTEITNAVTKAVQPIVVETELRRILRKPPENLGVWEAYQRGLWHEGKANAADNARARGYFQRAISLDPTFAPAYSSIGLTFGWEGGWYGTRPLEEAEELAITWAHRAIYIDATDAEAQATLAWLSNDEERQQHLSLALAGNPNSSFAHWFKGQILVHGGRPVEGRDAMLTALRLSPRDPRNGFLMPSVAVSHYYEGDYQSALEVAQHTVSLAPEHPVAYRWVAVSLGQLGRIAEAGVAIRKAISIAPASFAFYTRCCPRWMRLGDHEHMLEGLRKAGWNG